jgi:hypothetical protein
LDGLVNNKDEEKVLLENLIREETEYPD